RLLSQPPTRAGFARELESRMEQLRSEDPEQQVEALRQFQRAALFRVAVADLTGVLPLMQVSDRLTDIAELIVERALQLGWRQITAQFGVPTCGDGEGPRPVAICAVGYGKLGGMELGYGSDLDLVFLHDSHGEHQETSGARPIDNQLFFVRPAPWPARPSCARASSGCGSRYCASTCAVTACARRCATCASACAASSPRAMRSASTSSRTRAGSPTSSSSPSTGRCCGRASTRRLRCSPTPSASW